MTKRVAALFALILVNACGPASYGAADDLSACGNNCDAPAPSSANPSVANEGASGPVQLTDGGAPPPPPVPVSSSKTDGGAGADAGSVADAEAPDSSTAPSCACDFTGVRGNVITKACGATICWKPARATVTSIWLCASEETASPTFESCSNPD